MMQHPVAGAASQWLAYVDVPDLAAATARARALGAEVIQADVAVQDKGSFSLIVDPTGAMIGLWQTKKK